MKDNNGSDWQRREYLHMNAYIQLKVKPFLYIAGVSKQTFFLKSEQPHKNSNHEWYIRPQPLMNTFIFFNLFIYFRSPF